MRFSQAIVALAFIVGFGPTVSPGAEAPSQMRVRQLAGTVRVERFVLSANELARITDDVVIESETDIIIDGPLAVDEPGAQRRHAPNITLRAARRVLISGAITPANGRAGDPGLQGGRGTSLEIEAPLVVTHGAELRAGNGAEGVAASGGDGGSVIVRGRIVHADRLARPVLRAGHGGRGGDGGHRGGNGGDAICEPLPPGGGGWLPLC
ncbi:MAG: hypothetical protein JNJ48_05960, partial [Phycisphaerae bacterium]|nr:hypothetical protein [Phycisphaerae bacterium]